MGKKKEEKKLEKKLEKLKEKEEKKAKKKGDKEKKEGKKKEKKTSEQKGPVMQQCFLSHCSADGHLVDALDDVLVRNFVNCETFNTNREQNSSNAGEERTKMLKERLEESEIMIALISDSYLRSPICISELSVFCFAEKVVVPIMLCKEGPEFLKNLFGKDMIYIDAIGLVEPKINSDKQLTSLARQRLNLKSPEKAESVAADLAKKMVNTMTSLDFVVKDAEAAEKDFHDLFLQQGQSISSRAYIGGQEVYSNILEYCDEFGVTSVNTKPDSVKLVRDHMNDMDELLILSTTGRSLVHALSSEIMPQMLRNGVKVKMLLPNRYSSFMTDVAEIESPKNITDNQKRLSDEFTGVMNTLCRCLEEAGEANKGEIQVGCCYTMLRQTITIVRKGNYVWGQLSLTMPPKKTAEGTPCLSFEGEIDKLSMAKTAYEHVQSIIAMAQRRGTMQVLSENHQPDCFFLEKTTAAEVWDEYQKIARNNTLAKDGSYELIEVAAQHPLAEDGTPGKEFTLRLDRAVELYQSLTAEGKKVRIFVPGSRHQYQGVADAVSLSDAGKEYLAKKGIPKKNILGMDQIKKFKGEDGVYNSADECFVASEIFKKGDYHRLYCVCSSAQMLRKKLFYLAFGVIAQFHTVDADRMFHNDLYEIFETIPYVLYEDHTWQDPAGKEYQRTRAERVVPEDEK